LHDRLRQIHRLGGGPQGVEFLLHPPNALLALVQPDQLIVGDPGRTGLVGAADKADPRSVRPRDHAGLAVDQAEGVVGEDFYLEKAAADKIVEPLKPHLHGCTDVGGERSAPFAVHPPFGRPGGLNVQGIEAGVADHPNTGLALFRRHPFQSLARHLQQGGAEEPCNPVLPARTLQPDGQEILQSTAA